MSLNARLETCVAVAQLLRIRVEHLTGETSDEPTYDGDRLDQLESLLFDIEYKLSRLNVQQDVQLHPNLAIQQLPDSTTE